MQNQEPQYGYGQPVHEVVAEAKWSQVRAIRDANLKATDWVVIQSQEAGTPIPDEWKDYRQSLRDIPETFKNDPDSVVWPVKPII